MSDPGPPLLEIDFAEAEPAIPTPPRSTRTAPRGIGAVKSVPGRPSQPPMPEPVVRSIVGRNGVDGVRELPHSVEAEQWLISSAMLDGAEVVAKANAAGISRSSFANTSCAIIWACIESCVRRGLPPGAEVVVAELKSSGDLDRVGGIPGLTHISAQIPTTAQSSYFIDKVRELEVLRETIRAATRIVEEAHNFSGDLGGFLSEQTARLKSLEEGFVAGTEGDAASRLFDPKKLIPRPDAIYSVAGIPVCTPGNLTTIYSQAKTGKSSFIGAMMAAAMTWPNAGRDTLGVTGPNPAGHALVHFDTEQSPYDWQQLICTTLRRAGEKEPPPWFLSYTLAGMEAGKAERFVHSTLRSARKRFGGIHSIFIDGVADMVNDPNSPDECFPLVARLHGAAIEFNTAIVNILHLNPAAKDKSDKGRGHLGSQLERKCESNLTLKKEGEVTLVVAEGRQRGKPIPEGKGPAFRWSDEHHMHMSCPHPKASSDEPSSAKHRERRGIGDFLQFIAGPGKPPMSVKQIYKYASGVSTIKEAALKDMLNESAEDGTLERVIDPILGICYRRAL